MVLLHQTDRMQCPADAIDSFGQADPAKIPFRDNGKQVDADIGG